MNAVSFDVAGDRQGMMAEGDGESARPCVVVRVVAVFRAASAAVTFVVLQMPRERDSRFPLENDFSARAPSFQPFNFYLYSVGKYLHLLACRKFNSCCFMNHDREAEAREKGGTRLDLGGGCPWQYSVRVRLRRLHFTERIHSSVL